MPDVTISYKGNSIATMSASGTKTLLTDGKYCEDDITVAYTRPSVSAGSATTPNTNIPVTPTITVSSSGLITTTVNASQSVTPTVVAGYVSSGTAGTITVSGSNATELTTKTAQTYTPTTTNQTISSGQYLTGTQTILGDANLLAENIKDGVTIFGVTGTYTGGGGGTYTVTISLTNPRNSEGFSSFSIYEQLSADYMDVGENLGHITSPTGSTQVSVSSSIYGIATYAYGWSVESGTANCTGGVTFAGSDYAGYDYFEVVGDGTITIDGIDYDY